MSSRADVTAAVSYGVSAAAFVGGFIAEHWLQVLSAISIVATYLTHLYFAKRKDRREQERERRELERHEAEKLRQAQGVNDA